MKKNGIDAFEGKVCEMNKVTGGFFTYDTETAAGQEDCQQVTEPGDTYEGNYNSGNTNWQDEFTVYSREDPGNGGSNPGVLR
tara:strand:+ start:219 stop:464 length:246 start_codon:yes stop_codon:yes gene_type:complete